jgi:hypothetical protein
MADSKMYAIAVAFESNEGQTFFVVNDDERDALIRGLDFLSKISYDVTTMPAFDASFTTRSGLCVATHNERDGSTSSICSLTMWRESP